MNTFAAMKPALRPPEALGVRTGVDAVAASPEGGAEAFGAVLGALKEGRPSEEARREEKTRDDTASGMVASPADSASTLLGFVDTGTVAQVPMPPLDPAALQTLLARAVPVAAPMPGETPSTSALAIPGPDVATAGHAAPGQTVVAPVASAENVLVPAGVADVAAGIALAIGRNGAGGNGPVQPAPTGPGSIDVPGQTGFAPQASGEARPQVTILRQETHFAPVRPRLVAGQSVAMSPVAPAGAAMPASVVPAPTLATALTMTEAAPVAQSAAVAASVVDAPAASVLPASVASPEMPVAAIRAAPPPAGSVPVPSPDSAGRPRRAEPLAATVESVTVASPAAQRIAGQVLPVEGTQAISAEVPAAEAAPRDGIAPLTTAPGGGLPSAASHGQPARQVAEAVASELGRPAATSNTPVTAGGEGPLRLLTIQLRPMDLGTVLVRMRLRDGQLEMSLHASREETAALLRQDGALLTDLLRNSGYQPDTVTIASNATGAPTQGDAGRPGSGTPFQPGGQGGPAQGGANPDQAPRRQGDANADERTDLTHERTHETMSSGPDRSGLYL